MKQFFFNLNNKQNLSVEEEKALGELQSRDDIVITEADKGGAVVVLDVEDYIKAETAP